MIRQFILKSTFIVAILIFFLSLFYTHSQDTENETEFNPAHFGIPDTIAGFEVLGVQTSDNTECFPEQFMLVVVRPTQSDSDQHAIYETLEELPIPHHRLSYMVLDVAMTRADFAQAIGLNNAWYEYEDNNCTSTGNFMTFEDSPPETIIDGKTEFDPVNFGVPATIAGYEVVAVQTSANTRCFQDDFMGIVLGSTLDDVEVFTWNNRSIIEEALHELDVSYRQVRFMAVSPSTVKNDYVYITRRSNARFDKYGCPWSLDDNREIPPETIIDVRTEFDPVNFGLPYKAGDYEVLSVQSAENTRCFQENYWRILLRAPPSTFEGFIRGGGGSLGALSVPDGIEWDIEYVGSSSPISENPSPRPNSGFGIRERNIRYDENGCPPPMGGGLLLWTPTPPPSSD